MVGNGSHRSGAIQRAYSMRSLISCAGACRRPTRQRAHRLDRDQVRTGAPFRTRARSCRGWNRLQQREIGIEIGVTAQRIDRDLRAEALAVTHIAPVGAARNRRRRARRAIDARQALQQSAHAAQINGQSARGTFRLVDRLKCRALAKIAGVAHGMPQKVLVTIFSAAWLIFH